MSTVREDCVYNAKLAEQAERYDEMKDFMKQVANTEGDLTVEERNLLSVAYKNAVGARRASWRVISSVEERKRSKSETQLTALAASYRKKIEVELKSICDDILNLLDNVLIPAASAAELKVFFFKMKGDYFRYIAEFVENSEKKAPTEKAEEAYEAASQLAAAELPPTHPIRLGLALNFSVFHYEILTDPAKACQMAREAFDLAIAELDTVSEDSYRDSTLIMHLLRDNLTLWQSDQDKEKEPGTNPEQPEAQAPAAAKTEA